MKRWIAIFLLAALFTGCASAGVPPTQTAQTFSSSDLMAGIQAKEAVPAEDLTAGSEAVADFGMALLQQTMEAGENTLISPLSVMYALAMTANGARGETLSQMEEVLGSQVEELNRWLHSYMQTLPQEADCQLHLANGIWFTQDSRFTVNREFLQTNADYYGAGIYQAPFDDTTAADINAFVNDHTKGMIPHILDQVPEDAAMYLVNALAFEAKWQSVYCEGDVREWTFTAADGTQYQVEMMLGEESRYLSDAYAQGFLKYYSGGQYAFLAMLPNEDVSLQSYVQSLTGTHLRDLLAQKNGPVLAGIPKFEAGSDAQLSDVLQEMGMVLPFGGGDLSGIGTHTNGGLFISRVLHKTYISVGEQGTKAGAATVVEILPESASPEPEPVPEVILDRPFVYMLIDTQTGTPFFVGVFQTPQN